MRALVPGLLLALCACPALPGPSGGGPDGDPAADDDDSAAGDDDPAPDDDDSAGPFDPGPDPDAPLDPVPGELTIVQLRLGSVGLGESAVIVGPDGSLTLLDLGGSTHDDDVMEVVVDLNTRRLVPARGFRARAPRQVEHLVLTHYHGDHVGAFEDLLSGDEPLDVTRAIVHRGFTDLGPAADENDVQALCEALRGELAPLDRPACTAEPAPPCDDRDRSGTYPAIACPGLYAGELGDPADDGAGEPSWLDLGGGARLELVAANAHASDGEGVWPAPPFGHDDSGTENARSLVGVLRHGAFRYHFGGDLTGAGTADEPDVESHLAAISGPAFYGALGVDVAHAHHHARDSSSNPALVDLLAPRDGRDRNVVAGLNAAYWGSPDPSVVRAFADGGRLGAGRFWVPMTAPGGATPSDFPALVDADGPVVVQTVQGGRGYRVQAGGTLFSAAFRSVRD